MFTYEVLSGFSDSFYIKRTAVMVHQVCGEGVL